MLILINRPRPLREMLNEHKVRRGENIMQEEKLKNNNRQEIGAESDMKSLLLRESELQERLKAISADIRGGLDPDSEERAVQLENREVLEEIERVTSLELARVRELIARAKAG